MASRTSASFGGVHYLNGRMPASMLGKLDGKHGSSQTVTAFLRKDAAGSFNRARAEIKRVHNETLSVRGWYRTLAEQIRFYNRTHSAAVAVPGYSNHGLGLAIDVSNFGGVGQFNNARRRKLIGILKKHGWTEVEGRRVNEPWHLVYDPSQDDGKTSSKSHTRVTTAPVRLRETPNGDVERVLEEGFRFSVRNGVSKKVNGIWWVQTTGKNWIASDYTKKV